MPDLLSSPARLVDVSAINTLKRFLLFHGALGVRIARPGPAITEVDKLRMLPLIFGLMPASAFELIAARKPLKPAIAAHLRELGCEEGEELVSLVKSLCEQYHATRRNPHTNRSAVRKFGISDVRAQPSAYRKLSGLQNNRCAVCGRSFTEQTTPTLDHIVPFRLIGDVPDGSNWQLLCAECNSAKGTLVSALQSEHSYNWMYSLGSQLPPTTTVHLETRYVTLAQKRQCEVGQCSATPLTHELRLERRVQSGLAVADNLRVVCASHARCEVEIQHLHREHHVDA